MTGKGKVTVRPASLQGSFFLLLGILVLLSGCAVKEQIGISSISFGMTENECDLQMDLSAQPEGELIVVRAPYGTKTNSLVPQITYRGAELYPPNGIPQDFSQPVLYEVREGEKTKRYLVAIIPESEPGGFPYPGDGVPGKVIDESLELPGGAVFRFTGPPDYSLSERVYPLHLHFHGVGGDAYGSEKKFPFGQVAGTPGLEFFLGTWESGPFELGQVIDYFVRNFPVDPQRIWLSGHSTGAWKVMDRSCGLEDDNVKVEVAMIMASPYNLGCFAGKHLLILSGSHDFVPFFGFRTNRMIYKHTTENLGCRREAYSEISLSGYPYPVSRYVSYECREGEEVHFYNLKGEMHNPFLSRNFALNLIHEAYRLGKPMRLREGPEGDSFSYLAPSQ